MRKTDFLPYPTSKRPAATPQLQKEADESFFCGIPAPPILRIAIKNRNFFFFLLLLDSVLSVIPKNLLSHLLSVRRLAPDIQEGKGLMDVDGLLVFLRLSRGRQPQPTCPC